ncbi:MAG: methionine ABC transporter ATP-binding protein, partial [Pseudomonas sp.]|nr:methionine ABC transporter ATP-binding protein [Pseudomonas sp.]
CDEATSALDPQTTASVLQLLAEINRELKLTIVLITHEMDVIRRVCDRVAVMDAGQIVEQGPVAEVFLHPQHATTRRFVQEDEQIDENEQRDDFAHVPGRIVRLTFQGCATYAPLLGTVARETGVDYSILAGRIDRIKDIPYGQLTLALIGGDMDAAFARFTAADVHMEVLR